MHTGCHPLPKCGLMRGGRGWAGVWAQALLQSLSFRAWRPGHPTWLLQAGPRVGLLRQGGAAALARDPALPASCPRRPPCGLQCGLWAECCTHCPSPSPGAQGNALSHVHVHWPHSARDGPEVLAGPAFQSMPLVLLLGTGL